MSLLPQRLAVIGGGTMGIDIAAIFSAAGVPVEIVEPARERWDAARERLAVSIAHLGAGAHTSLPAPVAMHAALEDTGWPAIDLVIECAPENLALKQQIFARMALLAHPAAVLASNSSSYPVSEIARGLETQERMLGLHFFMPAHLVPAVEVIKSEATPAALWERHGEMMRALGKIPVMVASDIPGFVANRLQHALMREAWSLINAGLARPEDIDAAVRYGFGLRYLAAGPVLQKDLAGLDIHCAAATSVYPTLANDSAPPQALRDKVAQGKLGMKSGEGFYRWTAESAARERERYERVLIAALRVQKQDDGAPDA